MRVRERHRFTTTSSARHKALFKQKWFHYVLKRLRVLGQRCSYRRNSYWATTVVFDNRFEKGTIESIQTANIHAFAFERRIRHRGVDRTTGPHFGVIANAPQ